MKDSYSRKNGQAARTRRYVAATIIVLVLSLAVVQIFLNQTSVGSPRFVRMSLLIWAATVVVVLALLILAAVLGRNLIKLFFERRSGKVGSRFRTKMVSTFAVLSFLPAILLYFLAYSLINYSIDQWFSAPADQMMEYSRAIAEQYYSEMRARLEHYSRLGAASADAGLAPEARPRLAAKLEGLREAFQLGYLAVFGEDGAPVAEAGKQLGGDMHRDEILSLVTMALGGAGGFRVGPETPQDALREVVRSSAPLRSADGKVIGAVLAETEIPRSVHFKAFSVMEGYTAHQRLISEKSSLRFNFLLILALSTLLIVFAFCWFAMYLAKRITVPIQALAEGAAVVAAGRLDYRVECEAFDELEALVASFNRMTGDLEENKRHIEAAQESLRQSNVQLDDRRRYIEAILQTIGTGVLLVDPELRVRTANRAAQQMLEGQPAAGEISLEQLIPGRASGQVRALLRKSSVLGSIVRDIEIDLPGRHLHLAVTVTPLADSSGEKKGWVIVLDDVTELLRMEKLAAWQEVARRMAHEIKNPLTPIQLSAGRILNRYKQMRETNASGARGQSWQDALASFDNLLEECVRTITQEADSLKKLVDEFSRFARLPEVRMEEADVHEVLNDTLALYRDRVSGVRIVRSFSPEMPRLRLDPGQIKRMFINLFDNALEAMAENSTPKVLEIVTRCDDAKSRVRIEISDTGRGFPEEYRDSLFLPYFSTRKGGTGLGLAIVRQIVSDHHGYIRAESNPPIGTRMIIDLPLASP